MPCYKPITSWASPDVNPGTGKRPRVWNESEGLDNSRMELACGRCIGCRMDKAQEWAIRIMHERQQHDLCCFLTFTYNNHFLPSPPSLDKEHFRLFMKRLRADHKYRNPDSPPIKYFMCGEYGGQTRRPHYHAIIFGLNFTDKRLHKKSGSGSLLYTSAKLDELWGLGHCYIGNVTYASAGYVARYCLKKVNGEMADDHYRYVNTQTGETAVLAKEYLGVSKGLGKTHFEKHLTQMYRHDHVVINGHEAPIPKYYDRQLGKIDPDLLEEIKFQRQERARKNAANNTDERLAVREEIKKAQVVQLRRDLE